jgi:pSer/pThr/pTyr-binding forkhead associated (FHA) protein
MVQLRVLSGKKAGTCWVARRFPVRIGRSPKADLQLEEDGVWDEHLELSLTPQTGFRLKTLPNALAMVNGEPVSEAFLRNGDAIQLGAARIQFWLSDARQTRLTIREWAVWTGVALISLAQVALVYYLLTL